ncbi:MAG: flagellar motor stator protein MotA [Humidesulfovibrio sp.]|uniref:flagellar motor stator protein MotA n=1 Tax=Humidesulfovibrio sp. TaxID=2910988 RepID=UPI0027335DA0|nr:flagellar motor stator protein MotA [Humidesulfovibrio sp.]MDP2847482.1 flagellar motor stator protein MotA [Humidesulfovibrio sp.]
MFAIIGLVVVMGSVIGGYMFAGGNLHVLWQPAEVIIIMGSGIGSLIVASPMKVNVAIGKNLMTVFLGKPKGKKDYTDILLVLFDLLSLARREGVIALEAHVNKPDGSTIFTNRPSVLKNHHVLDFICDNFKAYTAASMEPHEFEALMDIDIDAHHEDAVQAPTNLNRLADAFPALGIVAAVMGVVLTMGKLSEPPEVLGHSIGAALVGTFLGVLLSYGIAGPLAAIMATMMQETSTQLNVVKAAMNAFAMGWPPAMALESARRAIPSHDRPGFDELEQMLRESKKGGGA